MMKEQSKFKTLSLKDFLIFSLFIYPLGFFWFISQNELIYFFQSEFVFAIISLLLFSVVNYIWGQLKIRPILLILSCGIGIFFSLKVLSNDFVDFIPDIPMTVLGAVITYFGMFLVFQFFQFFTWIPFIARLVWQNRKNLDELPFN
jgi:hypothetical protein